MSLITRGSVLFVAFPPQPAQLYSTGKVHTCVTLFPRTSVYRVSLLHALCTISKTNLIK